MPFTPTTFRGQSGPTKPMSHERILAVCYAYKTLHEAFVAAGGEVTSELYHTMLTIQTEIITWEQRSAKLRYAAKRQRLYRANARDERGGGGTTATYDAASDVFVGHNDPTEPSASDLPETTQATLHKYQEALAERNKAPDTSQYKKSGLV